MKTILYIMLLIFVSCGGNNNSNFEKNRNEQTQKITNKVKTINELKIDLRKSMIDYIKTGNANYNEKDVKKCISIIDKFLIDIKNSKSKEDGLLIVKNTVLQLNNINKKIVLCRTINILLILGKYLNLVLWTIRDLNP